MKGGGKLSMKRPTLEECEYDVTNEVGEMSKKQEYWW